MPTLFSSFVLRAAVVVAATLTSAALPAGCANPPQPVAVVGLAVDRSRVPVGGWLDVTIQFDVSPAAEPLSDNYRVVLQMLDEEDRILWSAEHDPAVPTSMWRPDQSIRYSRQVRIPPYPYIGAAALAIGLQSPVSGERLPLAASEVDDHTYRVATLVVDPPHESSFVVYEAGWHQPEFNVYGQTEWRWTTERAVLSFLNPRRDARLLLGVQGRPDLAGQPQSLSLVVGERTLAEVTLDTTEPLNLEYELTAAAVGDDDIVQLQLLVDRAFTPASATSDSTDTRQLGVRVFQAYIEPAPE